MRGEREICLDRIRERLLERERGGVREICTERIRERE